ncbi:MAG: hypothetical protein EZS28_017519 [Streblomastix strix]|uniref:Protein kinase domain-containing protein n=1 Tax=Streblomastix strix TaxID=222440 RepID=A0A5J4VWN3_9EUKA|nr:MAG: hypothetical protein EZS28_017519 [Streblomastix strix]
MRTAGSNRRNDAKGAPERMKLQCRDKDIILSKFDKFYITDYRQRDVVNVLHRLNFIPIPLFPKPRSCFRLFVLASQDRGEPIPFITLQNEVNYFDNSVVVKTDFANFYSLDNIIKRNYSLSNGTLRAIAKQLFQGLFMIHSRELIHRDIKAQNVLLHSPYDSGRVIIKIADFGLVKLQDQIQQALLMSSKGIPINLAPELVIGDGKVDAKVDMWSAGVVLFLLAGHEYPIKAMNIPDLQIPNAIQNDHLWDLLSKLLSYDRIQRPSANEALQHPYFTSFQVQKEMPEQLVLIWIFHILFLGMRLNRLLDLILKLNINKYTLRFQDSLINQIK